MWFQIFGPKGAAARLALWQRLDGNPEARRMLSTVTNTRDPATWEKQIKRGGVANRRPPPADYRVGELADVRREQQAAADAMARAVAVSSSSSSSSEDIFATGPFGDFWDAPEGNNCRASRN
ncbi:hypothetical protein ACN24K_31190 [Streptomyces microflavus]